MLEQFRVIGQQLDHDPPQGFVVLDAGVLLVRILHRVLIGGVSPDLAGNFLSDDPLDFIGVLLFDILTRSCAGWQSASILSINYPSMKISWLNLMHINVLTCLPLRP